MATSALEPLSVSLRALLRSPRAPLIALAVISVLSLGARAYKLGEPCSVPCTNANDHTLIFDEAYYVNAARVIAGIHPPSGSHYDDSPLGSDPNAEHPQGAKLIMAGAIELFGDGPFAWRIGSLIFGSLAILGMYFLVRSAGGDPWPAVGAAALLACDNLLLVHSRIGTLDIYALAPMIWGVALYLRGRWISAAVVLAIADCMKEVAPYALIVLALIELARALIAWRDPGAPEQWHWWPALVRWFACSILSVGLFIGGLGLMGLIARPYADAEGKFITGGPIDALRHMIVYASQLTAPKPTGIASYPWQWLLDLKPIVYLRVSSPLPGPGGGDHAGRVVHRRDEPADHAARGPGGDLLPGPTRRPSPALWAVVDAGAAARSPRRRADVDSRNRLVPGDVGALRAAAGARQPHQLHVLHDRRDAGDLRRGDPPGDARLPDADGAGCGR